MNRAILISALFLLINLAGCVSHDLVEEQESVRQYSFIANTMDAGSNSTEQFDLRDNLSQNPMILLWVSTGCYGCHDWTDTFRASIENGSLNASSIVSIHRYSDFESVEKLNQVYGVHNNSSHPTPWTMVIPNQNTSVLDFNTGEIVNDFSIYEAFNHPVTPTIQIVNSDGEIAWTSNEYWPSDVALQDVLQSLSNVS